MMTTINTHPKQAPQTDASTPLKDYLVSNDVKLVQLAKDLDVSVPYLSKIVNGWANERTTRRWAPAIAEKLGQPVETLFPGLELEPAKA